MLDKKKKQRVIEKFQTRANDTGSPQVQIAILSEEIKELSNHLLTHKKDNSSRKGLLHKVSQRRRLTNYLKKDDPKAYGTLVEKLKLTV